MALRVETAGSGVARTAHYIVPSSAVNPIQAFLVEPQATNLFERSEEINNAYWQKLASSVSADATVAPDGTTTADKLVEDATTANHVFRRSIAFTSGTVYTASIFAKASERTTFRIQFPSAAFTQAASATFNLSAGTASSNAGSFTARIVALADGWYRCSYRGTATATSTTNLTYQLQDASYAGDGTSGVFFWGAQLEEGSVATSYIKTVSGTASRNQDVVYWPDAALVPQALTLYVRMVNIGALAIPNIGLRQIVQIGGDDGDASVGEFFRIGYDNNTNTVTASYRDGTDTNTSGTVTHTAVVNDIIEYRAVLLANAQCYIGTSINGAAEVVSTTSAGSAALVAAFTEARIYPGASLTTGMTPEALTHITVADGERALETMRSLAGVV
jgi:hypothetical protein